MAKPEARPQKGIHQHYSSVDVSSEKAIGNTADDV